MKIEIVVDPSRPAPPASLAARVAPPAAAAPATDAPARLVSPFEAASHGLGRNHKALIYIFPYFVELAGALSVDVAEDEGRTSGRRRRQLIWTQRWR